MRRARVWLIKGLVQMLLEKKTECEREELNAKKAMRKRKRERAMHLMRKSDFFWVQRMRDHVTVPSLPLSFPRLCMHAQNHERKR